MLYANLLTILLEAIPEHRLIVNPDLNSVTRPDPDHTQVGQVRALDIFLPPTFTFGNFVAP